MGLCWGCCATSEYQDVVEVVPRKLYRAWDSDSHRMVALKLVETYGFSAASAWAEQGIAVPSQLVRCALYCGRPTVCVHRDTAL